MAYYESKEWSRFWYDEARDTSVSRVLLIGDSIVAGCTPFVNRALGKDCRADSLTSSKALDHPFYDEEIDFFARQFGFRYQVIHFNNGLHGFHLDAEEYARLYEEKVRFLLKRFPESRLVLAASTPITDENRRLHEEKNAVVLARNEKVLAIARKYDLPVNDLYAAMVAHPEWKLRDGYHYTEDGQTAQGEAIAACVRRQLDYLKEDKTMDNKGCAYCFEGAELDKFGIKICELPASKLYLFKEQSHKGRVIVAHKKHVSEIVELTDEERNAFFADVDHVAKALHAAFHPDKINYGAYGDTGHHLHFHLVPKYRDGYEWGGVFAMNPGEKLLSAEEYEALIAEIKAQL